MPPYFRQMVTAFLLFVLPVIAMQKGNIPTGIIPYWSLFLIVLAGHVIILDVIRIVRYLKRINEGVWQAPEAGHLLRCISEILIITLDVGTIIWDLFTPQQFPIEVRSILLAIYLPLSYLGASRLYDQELAAERALAPKERLQ